MRSARFSPLAVALVVVAATLAAPAAHAQDPDGDIAVADGGIFVDGWTGRIDARAAAQGQTLDNARLALDGDALHVKTGPATTYWNPANTASGEYTVRATFHEPRYMSLNDHPHPYGIVIAGNDMGTDGQSYLYCAAYGNGTFIVRGFGPEPFQMGDRRPQDHDAVSRAPARYEPVTQEIAVSVRPDRVECAINGTVVASFPKSELVTEGQLVSTDGVYGLRFAHNTEATVTGLTVTRP